MFYLGSEFFHLRSRIKKAPDPGSGSTTKNLAFLIKKMLQSSRKKDIGYLSIPDPDFFHPETGSGSRRRGQKSTESRIQIRNNAPANTSTTSLEEKKHNTTKSIIPNRKQ
jgi:hypothetical protein